MVESAASAFHSSFSCGKEPLHVGKSEGCSGVGPHSHNRHGLVKLETRALAGIGTEGDSPIDQRPTDSNGLGEEVVLCDLGAGDVAQWGVDSPPAELDAQLIVGSQNNKAVGRLDAHQPEEASVFGIEVELELFIAGGAHYLLRIVGAGPEGLGNADVDEGRLT